MTNISYSNVSTDQIITQTRHWIKTVVVGHQFCPFAGQVFDAESIHYQVIEQVQTEVLLQTLINECQRLDRTQAIETTLIIYPLGVSDFECYLDLLELAEELLVEQGYEGIYQLASFHPNYQFEGAEIDDPSNYTNRSPYPMLHLLREASLERAISDYPDIEIIPERNINYAKSLGIEKLSDGLKSCYECNTF